MKLVQSIYHPHYPAFLKLYRASGSAEFQMQLGVSAL